MYKIFSVTFGICLIAGTALSQINQPYVRKKIQPNFFIPEGALSESQPERVGLPQYRQGKTTVKRISKEPEIRQLAQPQYQVSNPTPINQTQKNNVQQTQSAIEPETSAQTSSPLSQQETQTNTPNYQKMYQDYLKDLDSIAKSGNVNTDYIDKDLSSMNSEKRIQIDKEFNSHRNVKNDILKALEN